MRVTLAPPPTPIKLVTQLFHGVSVVDPYRWLEDGHSTQTREWLEKQENYTRSYLDDIPGRSCIFDRLRELLSVEVTEAPFITGSRYFFRKRAATKEQACIYMQEGINGPEQLLLDPSHFGPDRFTSLQILSISHDGRLMAFGVKRGGKDTQTVRILAVDERRILDDELPEGICRGIAFSMDTATFYYSHEGPCPRRSNYHAAYRHTLGAPFKDDREIFVAGEDETLKLNLCGSSNGKYLLFTVTGSRPSRSKTLYFQEPDRDFESRLIARRENEVFVARLARTRLIVLTQCNAPNLRVVEIDPDYPAPECWREIVPQTGQRIQHLFVSDDNVFVTYDAPASTKTKVFDVDGRDKGEIPYPAQGTARVVACGPSDNEVFYSFESYIHPPRVARYRVDCGQQSTWSIRDVLFDSSSVTVRHAIYESKDGTSIPISLLFKTGSADRGPKPIVLTAYGAFANSCTPQFTAFGSFIAEKGGLFAVANVRGGGELGEAWHEAAMRGNRQNAIDDLISAAEWLTREGLASAQKIGTIGASGGALLVAAAMVQRPDLFRAVVCIGPLLDMLRYDLFGPSRFWVQEFGSARNVEDFAYLFQYSPYHRVQKGTAYPAVLLISGDADERCDGMHARKMTARLQSATSSGCPVLLDYKPMRGHSPVLPLTERIDGLTDRLAFLCQELGIDVKQKSCTP